MPTPKLVLDGEAVNTLLSLKPASRQRILSIAPVRNWT